MTIKLKLKSNLYSLDSHLSHRHDERKEAGGKIYNASAEIKVDEKNFQ